MAKIQGIVGQFDVNLDAPGFATEQSLQNLIKAVEGKSTGGPAAAAARSSRDATNAANEFAQAAFDFGNTIDLTSDQVQESGTRFAKAFDEVGAAAVSAATDMGKNFERMASAGDEQSGRLSSTVDYIAQGARSVVDALDDMVEGIPLIGGAISAFTTDIAKAGVEFGSFALGFVTGNLEGLREQQGRLFDSGVYFAKGIDDAAKIASDAGTTIGVLAKTASDANDSLRFFEGGAANGMRVITTAFKNFKKTNQTLLYAMGYTQDEILTGIADYGASMSQAGKQLSQEELEKGSLEYLVNLKELSRLTGASIKEQRDAQEAGRRSLFVQNQLSGLGEKQRAATEAFLAGIPEVMRSFALSGQAFDSQTAIIANRLPTYSAGLAEITEKLKTGALSDTQALDQYRQMMNDPAVKAEIEANQRILGNAPAEVYGSLSGVVTALGQLQAQINGNIEAAKADAEKLDLGSIRQIIEDAAKAESKGIDTSASSLTIAIGKYTEIETTLATQMQSASVLMTKKALDFASGLGDLLKMMLNKISTEADGQVQSLLNDIETNFWDKTKESFNVGGAEKDPYAALTADQLKAAGLKRSTRPVGRAGASIVTYEKSMALGGPVKKDNPYLVGETGPEKFVPKQSGMIEPLESVPVKFDNKSFDEIANMLKSLVNGIGESTLSMEEVGPNIADQIVSKASEYFAAQEPIANKPEREESIASLPTQVKVDLPGLGEMNQRLDSLIKLNSAMLDAMNKGNSIERQAMLFTR